MVLALVVLPVGVNLLVVKYEMAMYLMMPIVVAMFIRAVTSDFDRHEWIDKVIRNCIVISIATVIFI